MNSIRKWLIRKLIGSSDVNQMLDLTRAGTYADLVKFIAENLAKDSERYTREFMSQRVANLELDFLGRIIQANRNLNATQKDALLHILQASELKDITYLR